MVSTTFKQLPPTPGSGQSNQPPDPTDNPNGSTTFKIPPPTAGSPTTTGASTNPISSTTTTTTTTMKNSSPVSTTTTGKSSPDSIVGQTSTLGTPPSTVVTSRSTATPEGIVASTAAAVTMSPAIIFAVIMSALAALVLFALLVWLCVYCFNRNRLKQRAVYVEDNRSIPKTATLQVMPAQQNQVMLYDELGQRTITPKYPTYSAVVRPSSTVMQNYQNDRTEVVSALGNIPLYKGSEPLRSSDEVELRVTVRNPQREYSTIGTLSGLSTGGASNRTTMLTIGDDKDLYSY